jgi:hypoxanthine phosphoribosyltransferase
VHDDIAEVIIPAVRLRRRVREMGRQIAADYAGRDLHLISVLRGGMFFLTDLAQAIDMPLSLDTLAVSSYTGQTQGSVRLTKDLDDSIEGRHVLLVEDIIDTGLTLGYIRRILLAREPASLTLCTLLDRPYRRLVEPKVAYTGFTIPDVFVVGYGLDWRGRYRNLPYLGVLKPELYK